ncbi:hypothetical protein CEXT_510111 [Caerostris extrusa]|uniref:Uncharacterized protein n=1 Tax=Caerostris extrusa TaxID=172846 RepID=A0AAV4XR73_CAEEX|nr:hypothetical protein CEXT_510111 [Caerostris extrusa]
MICVWLLEARLFGSAENRYVGYFQKVKEKCNGVPPEEIPLRFYVQWDYLDNPHKPKTWKVFRENYQ